MDYFVRKGSDYSELSMELIKDGHTDYESFYKDIMDDTTITFTMLNADSGIPKVVNATGSVCVEEDCFLSYKFKKEDVNTPGTYIGKFNIKFNTSGKTLVVPIREELYIHVLK